MDPFVYYTPTKVYFGPGEENNIGKYIKEYSPKKVLIHYGGGSIVRSGLLARVESALTNEGIPFIELGGVVPNPELKLVREGIKLCLKEGVDFVLAIGGGSVLDSAKDIANGVANPDIDVWDFSIKKAIPQKTLHKAAILTISAAGSEMSTSCVITNEITKTKRGYNSFCNQFDFAIENPELTFTVSPYQTACGAVDIAMHTIERYFCLGEGSDLTDALSEAIITTTNRFALAALENPNDYNARSNLMWASSLTHNGLTSCGKKVAMQVHQLEHELSGLYPEIAHGAGLAALWCSWARYVYPSCKARFLKYVRNVWGITEQDEDKAILEGIAKQETFYKQLGMPTSLEELGVMREDLESLALNCSQNKTRVVPGYKPLSYEDDLDIYSMAFAKH